MQCLVLTSGQTLPAPSDQVSLVEEAKEFDVSKLVDLSEHTVRGVCAINDFEGPFCYTVVVRTAAYPKL